MSESLQVWVRNDKGQVYGPLSPPSVELLIDNGIVKGRLQVSTDGINYVYPGRVPGLRMVFPRETWGDTVVPGDELDAQWGQVVLPAALPSLGDPTPMSSPSGLRAATAAAPPGGPVMPAAAPAGGPVAGPGARQQAARALHPTQGRGPPMASGASGIRAAPLASGASGIRAPPLASGASGVRAPPMRSTPSVVDFMNAAVPQPAAPVRSSPSVADFMNAAVPPAAAPARAGPAVAAQAPAAPPRPPSQSGIAAVPASAGEPGALEVPPSGELSQVSPLQLYYFIAGSEGSGLLTLQLPDRELSVHFRKGNPEFLDSTHPEDSLEVFLINQKLATPAQIQQAQAGSAKFGGDLLGALFGLGLLNPNAVFQHLGQRASQLLLRALSAEQGRFTYDLEELPAARAMPLGNKWAVYLQALRKVPGPDLRRRLVNELELPVMKATGRVPVADLRLTPQETRALNYFDGVRSLSQLIKDVPAEADHVLRTAWMLFPLELVSFAGVTVRAAPPPPAASKVSAPPPAPAAPKVSAPPPAPAPAPAAPRVSAPAPAPVAPKVSAPAAVPGPPAQPPRVGAPFPGSQPSRPPPPVMKPAAPAAPAPAAPTAANQEAETRQLQALLATMKEQNHFEVLGVKRDADPNAVKIAYLKAARSYHPDTVPPGSPEALAKVKADIFARIGEANRTLSDAALRAEYVAELDAGGTGNKVDIEKILRAEEVFQKGRILVQARKYADAAKLFDEAISCNEEEGEFYAWRGYSRYLASKDRKAIQGEVMKDLNLCIAKNPNVAATYYFLGFIAKANGDEKGALNNFRKCVALDPKHIDAQRELRTMKK